MSMIAWVRIYTACLGARTRSSFTVFAHESPPRSAKFEAENCLYLFALTVPVRVLVLAKTGTVVSSTCKRSAARTCSRSRASTQSASVEVSISIPSRARPRSGDGLGWGPLRKLWRK